MHSRTYTACGHPFTVLHSRTYASSGHQFIVHGYEVLLRGLFATDFLHENSAAISMLPQVSAWFFLNWIRWTPPTPPPEGGAEIGDPFALNYVI
jgi:hypothetical protein